jgi:hypothetical protein
LPVPFVNVISGYRMFAKPILLNSLTSCDFVFSEQTQNLNETTKTLYIEAIFVFFVHKRNTEYNSKGITFIFYTSPSF